jgi:hypothetical protein
MNRREFLATGFRLGAAGLLLPAIEPIRRSWSLDRTMLPNDGVVFGNRFGEWPATFVKTGLYDYYPTMPHDQVGEPIRVIGPRFDSAREVIAWYRRNHANMDIATYLKVPRTYAASSLT